MSTKELDSNITNQVSEPDTNIVSEPELSKTCEVVIDCAAFQPRPDSILISILEGTQLSINDFVKESAFYGSWTFIPLKEKESLYLQNQLLIGEKLKKFFNAGQIRAAEW